MSSVAFLIFLLSVPWLLSAKNAEEENVEPPPIGNFSLPGSQQPGAFISFGQNVIDAGLVQIALEANASFGNDIYATEITPNAVYGITDSFSCYFEIPFSAGDRDGSHHSSGVEDISAQFEYAFFNRCSCSSENEATVVAGITFPTGSSSKEPPTGFGSNTFFLGTTFCHIGIYWYYFTSYGALLTTSNHGTKFGDELLYQFGVGRYIPSPAGWLFSWLVELDGTYAWKDRIHNDKDPDSGGNVILLTPSLSFANKRVIIQFDAGYPIVQHLFGHQSKEYLFLDFEFTITF